jgi:alpha-beta hydrolase superfamily lysophospholipase
MRKILYIFAALVAVYLAACVGLYYGQRYIVYVPNYKYYRLEDVHANPALKEFPIHTPDGLDLKGWYAPATSKKLTIVFFHGNGDHLASVGSIADAYVANGYGILFAEYRGGYSAMPGVPSEEGLYTDARTFIKTLIANGVKEGDIVLMGHSLGTGVATQMATEFKAAGLVLLAPISSLDRMANIRFGMFPTSLLLRDHYNNEQKIANIHMPLLLAHSKQDIVVPFEEGFDLFEHAAEPKKMQVYEEGGHSALLYDKNFFDLCLGWLAQLPPRD